MNIEGNVSKFSVIHLDEVIISQICDRYANNYFLLELSWRDISERQLPGPLIGWRQGPLVTHDPEDLRGLVHRRPILKNVDSALQSLLYVQLKNTFILP